MNSKADFSYHENEVLEEGLDDSVFETDVLLVYPRLGPWDDIVRDLPLSVIYAATESVKRGYKVKVVDLRFWGDDWREAVDPILKRGVRLVGLSVMTGNPIRAALELSEYVKKNYPSTPVVWGGPHPTTLPEQTMKSSMVDYLICDGGSAPLAELIQYIKDNKSVALDKIVGLVYRRNGEVVINEMPSSFERLDFREIPYHLVGINAKKYNRLNSGELVIPMFMSAGCPFQCTFCVTPAMVKNYTGKRWVGYEVNEVLDHVQYALDNFQPARLQVLDDESFINLKTIREILRGYIDRGYAKRLRLDFRGIRINDVYRMKDEDLQLLCDAGTEYMFIGLESGSNRMLKEMKKGINVEQILEVNRRLSRFPQLKPHYNFFCGMPGETLDSLIETKDVLLQIVKDHPGAYLGHGGHWKPVPGSEAVTIAERDYGLVLPTTLLGWADIDTLDFDARPPEYSWYTPEMYRMIKLLTLAGLLLDAKTKDLIGNLHPLLSRMVHMLIVAYRPILRLRLRYNLTKGLFEMRIYNFAITRLGRLLKNEFRHRELRLDQTVGAES